MSELTRERVEHALTAAVPGRMPEQLIAYWTRGEGAAKIRWGTDGSFDRCVRALRKYFPRNPQGLCARLHKRATGEWPAEKGIQSSAGWGAPSDAEIDELAEEVGAALAEEFRNVSTEERKKLAKGGNALPDGSFPIANVADLRNAIQAIGRAKDPAKAKAHIRRRARELDAEELIPDTWALDDDPEGDRRPGDGEHDPAWDGAGLLAHGTHNQKTHGNRYPPTPGRPNINVPGGRARDLEAEQTARIRGATRERVQADIAETNRQREIASRGSGAANDPNVDRLATSTDRKRRFQEINKLSRTEFDALPESVQERLKADLREISTRGADELDMQTGRGTAGTRTRGQAEHVSAARETLRRLTAPRAPAVTQSGPASTGDRTRAVQSATNGTEIDAALKGASREQLAEIAAAIGMSDFDINEIKRSKLGYARSLVSKRAWSNVLDRERAGSATIVADAGGDDMDEDELTAHAGHDDPMIVTEGEAALALLDEEHDHEHGMVPMIDKWDGLLAPINEETGDGRIFREQSLSNRELPLPLLYQEVTTDGHKNSVVVGRILEVRHEAEGTYGSGDFLDEEIFPAVTKAKEALAAKVAGPSVDLDDVEYTFQNADGSPFDEAAFMAAQAEGTPMPKPKLAVTRGRVSAATLVAIPAFSQARPLTLSRVPDEDGILAALEADLEDCEDCFEAAALAASGYVGPELAAFAQRDLEGPTPFTITDDGQVFGHLATWSTCHVGFPGTCVTPPNTATGYAYFHTGEVQCADGTRVPVGRLVVGTPHADLSLAFKASAQHYDNTGRTAALVRAYEDEHGIQVCGVMVPDLDEESRAEFAAHPLSGDWRRVGGNLELIGAISVPVPGFPVARVTSPDLFREPEQVALVAAGVFHSPASQPVDGPVELSRTSAGPQQITLMIDGQEFSGTVTLSASSDAGVAAGPTAQESLAAQLDAELDAAFGMLQADRERVLAGLDLEG